MVTRTRFLIGGGGYSGLGCAHALQTHRMNDFILLEARDRPGGRAWSDTALVPGKVVDRGPEFFGENHRTLLRFAETFGIKKRPMYRYEGPFSPILPGCGLSAADRSGALVEMQALGHKLIELARSVDVRRPWDSPNAEFLDRSSLGDWLDRQEIGDLTRRAFDAQVVANHGVALHDLSLLSFLSIIAAHGLDDYITKTELYRLEGGAQELAKRLAHSMSANIRMGQEIAAVENRPDGVTVRCKSGEVYEADYFVLCLPPSVWGSIDFTPKLPPEARISMGMNCKVFAVIQGPEDFEAGLNPHCFMRDGLLQLIWDTTEDQEGGENEVVITCFSGGSQAVRLSQMSSSELWDVVCDELSESIHDIRRRLRRVDVAGWPRDPLTRAGYCAPSKGQMTTTLKLLREGFNRMSIGTEAVSYQMAFVCGALVRGLNLGGALYTQTTGLPSEFTDLIC